MITVITLGNGVGVGTCARRLGSRLDFAVAPRVGASWLMLARRGDALTVQRSSVKRRLGQSPTRGVVARRDP